MIGTLKTLMGSPDIDLPTKSTVVTAYVIVTFAIIKTLGDYIAPSFNFAGTKDWQLALLSLTILPLIVGIDNINAGAPIVGLLFFVYTLYTYRKQEEQEEQEEPEGGTPFLHVLALIALFFVFVSSAFGSLILSLIFPVTNPI